MVNNCNRANLTFNVILLFNIYIFGSEKEQSLYNVLWVKKQQHKIDIPRIPCVTLFFQ